MLRFYPPIESVCLCVCVCRGEGVKSVCQGSLLFSSGVHQRLPHLGLEFCCKSGVSIFGLPETHRVSVLFQIPASAEKSELINYKTFNKLETLTLAIANDKTKFVENSYYMNHIYYIYS